MVGNNWAWRPSPEQRALFEEWKKFTIGALVSSKEGFNIGTIPNFLEEQTGDRIPLERMGFRFINQFLYEMSDDIEVRTVDGRFYIFIREGSVPPNMQNIRAMVLGQQKDKSSRTKTGRIKRPTKNQCNYARPQELLTSIAHLLNRPASAFSQRSALGASTGGPVRRPGGAVTTGYGFRGGARSRPQTQKNNFPPRYSTTTNARTQPVTQVRRSPLPSSSSTAVRSTPVMPTAKVARPIQDDDDWSMPSTSSKPAQSTSRAPAGMTRRPLVHAGLIETESESDNYTSDDDGFEMYSGPRLAELTAQKKAAAAPSQPTAPNKPVEVEKPAVVFGVINKTSNPALSKPVSPQTVNRIVNEIGKPMPNGVMNSAPVSTVVNKAPINQPQPRVLAQVTSNKIVSPVGEPMPNRLVQLKPSNDIATSKPLRQSVPEPNTAGKSMPNGIISNANTESAPSRPVSTCETVKSETAKPVVKTTLLKVNSIPHNLPRRSVSATLDTTNVVAQNVLLNLYVKDPTVRMTFELPKIQMPQFLRGGSLHANCSLKSYLASIA